MGVTFEGRQSVVRSLDEGEELLMERDTGNPVDENAIRFLTPSGEQVGFLRRQIAAAIARSWMRGWSIAPRSYR